MDNLISRQAAIDALKSVDEYNARSVKAIKELPPVQPEQRWIPCSEMLPEIEYTEHSLTISKYLVTMLRTTKDKKCSRARVDFALFMPERKGDKWEGGTWKNDWLVSNETYDTEVIAWTPIPKPYNPIEGAMNPPEEEGDQKK